MRTFWWLMFRLGWLGLIAAGLGAMWLPAKGLFIAKLAGTSLLLMIVSGFEAEPDDLPDWFWDLK